MRRLALEYEEIVAHYCRNHIRSYVGGWVWNDGGAWGGSEMEYMATKVG